MLLLSSGSAGLAQEAVSLERPSPSSVDDVVTPMDETFKKPSERVPLTQALKDKLKDAPSFFRDTKLDVNLRTYYFYQDNFDSSKNQGWALGGSI